MAPPAESASTPYKGPQYFSAEDMDIFFGRDAEARDVCAMIELNDVSVLYAPSGAGKTSLLRARVLPRLEESQNTVALFRPAGDPFDALKASVLASLLPPPATEVAALARLIERLGRGDLDVGPEPTFDQARRAYREISLHDDARRGLLAGMSVVDLGAEPAAVFGADGADAVLTPVSARCLYLENWAPQLYRHLALLQRCGGLELPGVDLAGGLTARFHASARRELREVPLRALADAFAAPGVAEGHMALVRAVREAGGGPRAFFERLVEDLGIERGSLSVILVVDQFEQAFTLLDVRRREGFFAGLRELVDEDVDDPAAPVRLVLSMRDDFIARLDVMEPEWGRFEPRQKYGLALLARDAFRAAVESPAEAYGYGYSAEALALIEDGLMHEEAFAEPGQLQIVCTRLWEEYGKAHFRRCLEGSHDPGGPLADEALANRISAADIEAIGGVRKILEDHFERFLRALRGNRERIELLDMLAMLRTSQGQKNVRSIVTKAMLLNQPLRSVRLREDLLDRLRKESIVRVISRRGGDLVEIMHEFLLEPIVRATTRMRRDEPRWDDLTLGLQAVGTLQPLEFGASRKLTDAQCEAIGWFARHLDTGGANGLLAERMIYELLCSERPIEPGDGSDNFGFWCNAARKVRPRRLGTRSLEELAEGSGLLVAEEVEKLVARGDLGGLSTAVRQLLVRSAIHACPTALAEACLDALMSDESRRREEVSDG